MTIWEKKAIKIYELHDQGYSIRAIANKLKIANGTVQQYLHKPEVRAILKQKSPDTPQYHQIKFFNILIQFKWRK